MTAATAPKNNLWLGLISGTSRDAVEACILETTLEGRGEAPATPRPVRVHRRHSVPYPADLRAHLDELLSADAVSLADIAILDARIGQHFASTAAELLRQAGLPARALGGVGHHGQTLHHGAGSRAATPQRPHYTWQAGDPFYISETLAVPVWHDFRRADIAAGGEGAPLACGLHDIWLRDNNETRIVINLGGIANITVLAPGQAVIGFDTGPANTLLDLNAQRVLGQAFDDAGQLAAAGQIDNSLLAIMLEDSYFDQPSPKSTGIEYFSASWLDAALERRASQAKNAPTPADLQATLAELTAVTIKSAIVHSLTAHASGLSRPDRVLVCGGGVFNADLMRRLSHHLGTPVESTANLGLDPLAVEAATFAWLAATSEAGCPGNLPAVTGARASRILGSRISPIPRTSNENS
ncbi:MAG: anhydro-N-acetylmuramic acid kinase [Thioalkalivibrionaceae bacterium]